MVMQCDWLIKISQMLDGELSQEEVLKVRVHLATCITCHSAHKDFLEISKNLQSYQQDITILQQKTLNKILATYQWKKSILVPTPALTALLCIVFLLGFFFSSLAGFFSPFPIKPRSELSKKDKPFINKDLSFYDHRERATILVVKKSSLELGEKAK